MLQPGAIVSGRFQVEGLIGEGGLARVYKVRHLDLGSVHALKMLRFDHASLAERLLLEGRIQAQLKHPNIVPVTDIVRHEGQIGLLMEYLDQLNLETFLIRTGALPISQALEIFASILAAVTSAHDAGVLHRDLKPANVMLVRGRRGEFIPKVADFGIAKVVAEDEGSAKTAFGVTLGTPGYLAPEQVLDNTRIDQRSDIFALGIILYEMISGQVPFTEPSGASSIGATLRGEHLRLDELDDAVPKALSDALEKALAAEMDERFDDCRAFARAVLGGRPELLAYVLAENESPLTLKIGTGGLERLMTDETSFGVMEAVQVPGAPSNPTLAPDHADEDAALIPEAAASVADEPSGDLPSRNDLPPPNREGLRGYVVMGLAAGIIVLLGMLVWQRPWERPMQPEVRNIVPTPPVITPALEPVAVPEVVAEATPEPEPAPTETSRAPIAAVTPPVQPAVEPDPAAAVAALDTAELRAEGGTDEEPAEDVDVDDDGAVAEVEPPEPEEAEAPPAEPAVVEVEPEPEPTIPNLVASWNGEANGRPMTLKITSQEGTALRGEVTFLLGSSQRTAKLSGSITGTRVMLQDSQGAFIFTGTHAGDGIRGTYKGKGQKRALDFSVSR